MLKEIKEFIEKKSPNIELKGDRLEDTKKFFTMTVKEFKEKTAFTEEDVKAHETALQLEQSAYDFYKELFGKAKDEKTKEFFKFLMEQENAHYMFIQKAHEFIKNPDQFFAEEEGWIVEG